MLVLSKNSDQDLAEIISYYNLKRVGLGKIFFENFRKKAQKIIDHPLSYSKRHKNVRCAKIDKFPFIISYIIDTDSIIVIAVLHTSRNPNEITKRK